MQMFTNCIASRFVACKCQAWGHIDDIVIGHTDPIVLGNIVSDIMSDLKECNINVNMKKSVLEPTRALHALGALWDTISNEVTLTETMKLLILTIFYLLLSTENISRRMLQRCVGHLAYVWPFIGAPWFALHHIYESIESGDLAYDAILRTLIFRK